MEVVIRQEALELLFRMLLSCRCPLDEQEEQGIYDLLTKMQNGETLDYRNLLELFKPNASSVFHRLHQFSTWFVPCGCAKLIIEREHVIRHFASSYHWDHIVGERMSQTYKNVISIPRWFVGHMLLPVSIEKSADGVASGVFRYRGGEIRLRNLFLPTELDDVNARTCGVHFAAVLTPLSSEEDDVTRRLLEANPSFAQFSSDIDEIDYLDFERYGDYRAICSQRHARYFDE